MPDETQENAANPPQDPSQTEPDAESKGPKLPENTVAIEDAGNLKRKITITVPRAGIDAKLNEMFGELATSAQIPGFRIGHAPRRLIEKRFGREISTDVRNALVGEALKDLTDKHKLSTIGEPDLKLDDIKLPDAGDMTFSFEVEVAPEFELPNLDGIEVTRPKIEMTEQRIDEAIANLRRGHARFEPTEQPAIEGDVMLAGARITGSGIEPVEHHGLTLRVAPGQVEGLPLMDLGTALAGKKANDVVTLNVKAPEAHPREAWRDKDLTVELTVSQVRHMVLPEVDEQFIAGFGLDSMEQFRHAVGARVQFQIEREVLRNMRAQVCKHLLETIKFDLPAGVVTRHAQQLLTRRYVDLLQQGVPQDRINEAMTQMQATIGDEAQTDLRISFILGKLAEAEKIEVNDGEINARIAAMAQQQNRRPERLRQDMESDGSLNTLIDNLREEKALDKLLEKARISDLVTIPQAQPQPQEAAPEESKPAPKPDEPEQAPSTRQEEPAAKPAKADEAPEAKAAKKKVDAKKEQAPADKPAKKKAAEPKKAHDGAAKAHAPKKPAAKKEADSAKKPKPKKKPE